MVLIAGLASWQNQFGRRTVTDAKHLHSVPLLRQGLQSGYDVGARGWVLAVVGWMEELSDHSVWKCL